MLKHCLIIVSDKSLSSVEAKNMTHLGQLQAFKKRVTKAF